MLVVFGVGSVMLLVKKLLQKGLFIVMTFVVQFGKLRNR